MVTATPTAASGRPPAPPRAAQPRPTKTAFAVLMGLAVAVFISFRVFGGTTAESAEAFFAGMQAVPDHLNLLLVNGLIGVSVILFIVQLGWDALRVTLTVLGALLFGFLITFAFNFDAASRFTTGDFSVTLLSDAEPIESDVADLEYGRTRGGEFNAPVREPIREAEYRFAGTAGDVVTVLAFADGRRSEVDLRAELRGPDGQVLAEANSATAEQVERFEDADVRRETDAIIEAFTLPADGVYSLYAVPEAVPFTTTVREAFSATSTAYDAFLYGALGRPNRWAVWVQDAITLIILGLAVALVFRARQFSLGGEGQLYLGALVSGSIALAGGQLPGWIIIPLAILGAMTAGFLWGLIPGALKAYLGANELVSTLMLNAIATRFYELVLTFQLKPPDEGFIASASFPASAQLPVIIGGTQVTVAVFLAIAAVIAVWFILTRTALGYEIRMVGANLKFAAYGGINTRRTIMLSMAVSGIVAGLAGAHLGMGIHRQLIQNISIGLVFEGVVVALLARNNPLVIPFTGLIYAYLRAGAQFMERDANVSFEVVRIIQAAIILLISAEALIAFFAQRRARQKAETAAPVPAAGGAAHV
jgi:simple sugar transport system permease protein